MATGEKVTRKPVTFPSLRQSTASLGLISVIFVAILQLTACNSGYEPPPRPAHLGQGCGTDIASAGEGELRISCEAEAAVPAEVGTDCSECSGKSAVYVGSYKRSQVFEIRSPTSGLFRLNIAFFGYAPLSITTSASPDRTSLPFGDNYAAESWAPGTGHLYVHLAKGVNALTLREMYLGEIRIDHIDFTMVDVSELGQGSSQSIEGESPTNRFVGPGRPGLAPLGLSGLPVQLIYDCDECPGKKFFGPFFPENGIEFAVVVRRTGLYEIRIFHVSDARRDLQLNVNNTTVIHPVIEPTPNRVPVGQVILTYLEGGSNTLSIFGGSIDRVVVAPPQ